MDIRSNRKQTDQRRDGETTLKTAFENTKTAVVAKAEEIWKGVTEWWKQMEGDTETKIGTEMKEDQKNAFQGVIDSIKDTVTNTATGIWKVVTDAWNAMVKAATDIINGNPDSMAVKAGTAMKAVIDALLTVINNNTNTIVDKVKGIFDKVKKWYDDIVDLARRAANVKTPTPTPAPEPPGDAPPGDSPPGDTPNPPSDNPPAETTAQSINLRNLAMRPLNRLPMATTPNSMNIIVTLDGKEIGRTVAPVITGEIRVRTAVRI